MTHDATHGFASWVSLTHDIFIVGEFSRKTIKSRPVFVSPVFFIRMPRRYSSRRVQRRSRYSARRSNGVRRRSRRVPRTKRPRIQTSRRGKTRRGRRSQKFVRPRRVAGNPDSSLGVFFVRSRRFPLPRGVRPVTATATIKTVETNDYLGDEGRQRATLLPGYSDIATTFSLSTFDFRTFARVQLIQDSIEPPPATPFAANNTWKFFVRDVRVDHDIINQGPNEVNCTLYWCRMKYDSEVTTNPLTVWQESATTEQTNIAKFDQTYSPTAVGARPFDSYNFTSNATVLKTSRFTIQPGEKSRQSIVQQVNSLMSASMWERHSYSRRLSIFGMLVYHGGMVMDPVPNNARHTYAATRVGVISTYQCRARLMSHNRNWIDYDEDLAQAGYPGGTAVNYMNPETRTYSTVRPN